MELFKKQEEICRELGNRDGLQRSLGNQAANLQKWGKLDEAMELFKEQERICRELGIMEGLAVALCNQAALLGFTLRKTGEALPMAREAQEIATRYGLKSLTNGISDLVMRLEAKSYVRRSRKERPRRRKGS